MRNRNLKMIIGGGNPQTKSDRVKTQAGGYLSLNEECQFFIFINFKYEQIFKRLISR